MTQHLGLRDLVWPDNPSAAATSFQRHYSSYAGVPLSPSVCLSVSQQSCRISVKTTICGAGCGDKKSCQINSQTSGHALFHRDPIWSSGV